MRAFTVPSGVPNLLGNLRLRETGEEGEVDRLALRFVELREGRTNPFPFVLGERARCPHDRSRRRPHRPAFQS